MTHQTNHNTTDNLDALLREWHDENATSARANRDALMSRLAREDKGVVARIGDADGSPAITMRRPLWARTAPWLPVAASLAIMVSLVAFMMGEGGGHTGITSLADNTPAPNNSMESLRARGIVQNASFVPEGGRLDAVDNEGQIVGTCPLKHTDVTATIQGKFARVSVKQQYANPYADKIEAVYTFPLSNNAAVDRMTMTIGDRVIVGEVKERTVARNIYEQARSQGRTAALLEQERPNIFTQSVANIEPGAQITIEISYLELIKSNEGEYAFTFPMTVAPRYIPGYASGAPVDFHFQLPAGLDPRPGDIFLGQAAVDATAGHLSSGQVDALMQNAIAIQSPVRDMSDLNERMTNRRKADFVATYDDGTKEVGIIFDDNIGALNNRWFYCPIEPGLQPHVIAEQPALLAKNLGPNGGGAPFATDTDQVPDASRITPTPTRPEVRAGHDISIEVNLQTGGPGITSLDSVLHEIDRTDLIKPNDFTAPVGALIHLKDKNTIPNKDFVLKWRLNDESIENQVFSYNGDAGGFLTLSMLPPARTPFTETAVVPRELIFVLDTSGSMSGFPIEKAKEVMTRAISQMRQFDAFNVITFAGATRILWDEPRQATEENIALANAFVNNQSGNGGTEMMAAINAALSQTINKPRRPWLTPEQLLNEPTNRPEEVVVRYRLSGRAYLNIEGQPSFEIVTAPGEAITVSGVEHWTVKLGIVDPESTVTLELRGNWINSYGMDLFAVSQAQLVPNDFITAEELLNLPADGRRVELLINSFTDAHDPLFQTSDESIQPLSQWVRHLRMTARIIEHEFRKATIVGRWTTQNAQRVFVMEQWGGWGGADQQTIRPVRICMFLTDGQVGNDHAIIEAVKQNAGTTRVFSFGVGNAPNRYLLDGIALAGRGAADYVTLADDGGGIVDRFTTRILTPLLSDVSIEFNTPIPMLDIVSPNVMGELRKEEWGGRNDIFLMPDLYDRAPITLHARFNNNANTALTGTATVRGRTHTGPFERVIQLNFPAPAPAGALAEQQSLLPTLWAREKVNQLLATDLSGLQLGAPKGDIRQQVITLGETFSIMTPFTSFVAVDRARVTIAGTPRLVHVPVELPEGQSYEGIFGQACRQFIFTANNMQATREDDSLSTNARVLEWVTDEEPDAAQGVTGTRRKSETVGSYRANTGGIIPVQQGSDSLTDLAISGGGGSFPADALDQLGSTVYYIDPASGVPAGLENFTFLAGSTFNTVTLENTGELMQAAIDARIDEFRAGIAFDALSSLDESNTLADRFINDDGDATFFAIEPTTRGIEPRESLGRERLRRMQTTTASSPPPPTEADAPQLDLEAVLKSGEALTGSAESSEDKLNVSFHDLDGDGMQDEAARVFADASKTDDATIPQPEPSEIDKQRAQLLRTAAIYAHLSRVLHPTLQQALAIAMNAPDKNDAAPISVTVLLTDTDEATIKALYDAGLKVKATNHNLLIAVGDINPARLANLALTKGVRRVEPTEAESTPPAGN